MRSGLLDEDNTIENRTSKAPHGRGSSVYKGRSHSRQQPYAPDGSRPAFGRWLGPARTPDRQEGRWDRRQAQTLSPPEQAALCTAHRRLNSPDK